jgi:SAM-dependent methyltransferase
MRNMERPRTIPAVVSAPPDLYAIRRREAIYRWIAQRCVADGRRRVLDLGSRDGFGSAILAAQGLEVLAVEPDPDLASSAQRMWRFGRLTFDTADLEDTDLDPGSVDAVVCVGCLECHTDPRPLLLEMQRLVLTGGGIYLATANRLVASPGRTRPIAAAHAWEYTADELHRLVSWRFTQARIHAVTQGRRLRLIERAMGGSLASELSRLRPADRTMWLRIALGVLRASDFRVSAGAPRDALDLIAVASA